MLFRYAVIPFLALLAACSGPNIQFNQTAGYLPANYEALSRAAVSSMAHAGPIRISAPMTTSGQNVFGPLRWYTCVFGLAPVGTPPRPRDLVWPALSRIFGQAEPIPRYEVVVLFHESRPASTLSFWNSELCRNA